MARVQVRVRPMTPSEFDEWRLASAHAYAADQIAAGRRRSEGAVERALRENAELLPDGLHTERMLVLRGIDEHGEPVGSAWVALDHPRDAPNVAFLYDIEVLETHRGRGYGRALLSAVEVAAKQAGAAALELNVFGTNDRAVSLYSSSGYAVVTQQMRKPL